MVRFFGIMAGGIVVGLVIGFLISFFNSQILPGNLGQPRKQVIGFLPYWLVEKADKDYSKFLTTLTYFSLTIDEDGKILKLVNPQEEEPGWHALKSGKLDKSLEAAKKKGLNLSLLMFAGDPDSIDGLISDPVLHGKTLVEEVAPIMKKHGFTDLNLDVESIREASEGARLNFEQLVKTVKDGLNSEHLGTLTVEIGPTDLIKKRLIDPQKIGEIADSVVLMGYDYHYIGSSVTGPVAPLGGAGVESEFDTQTAVEKALAVMPSRKLILGLPLYGYEWETLGDQPRAAVIPGTGLIASNKRIEVLLGSCASCSARMEETAAEPYLIYKDEVASTFHQLFYPDAAALQTKINYVRSQKLGGVALWALGYEGSTILEPLKSF